MASANLIMAFLLKERNSNNIVDLPLFMTTHAKRVSLGVLPSKTAFVLLSSSETDLFGHLDDSAISTNSLPASALAVLYNNPTQKLNLARLTPERVLKYLTVDHPLSWLLKFWKWLSYEWSSNARELLCHGRFGELPVIPCRSGVKAINVSIFDCQQRPYLDSSRIIDAFHECGLHIVSPDFPRDAAALLCSTSQLHLLDDLAFVIDCLQAAPLRSLSSAPQTTLLDYFARLTTYGADLGSTSLQQLRGLPIWRVLEPSYSTDGLSTSSISVTHIPNPGNVINVKRDVTLVPDISNTTFISNTAPHLAKLLGNSVAEGGTQVNQDYVLGKALTVFSHQCRPSQHAFLEHMVKRKEFLPLSFLTSLARQSFVPVRGSSHHERCPAELVDPASKVASLLDPGNVRLPACADTQESAIIDLLRQLGVLQNSLDRQLIEDTFTRVADETLQEETRYTVAVKLLAMISEQHVDCSEFALSRTARCLPTDTGCMASAHECFDPEVVDRLLYDQVASSVSSTLTPSIRKCFGLDHMVSLSVLIHQLRNVVASQIQGKHRRLTAIIKELGGRWHDLAEKDVRSLQSTLEGVCWVPVSGGRIVSSDNAVFINPFPANVSSGIPFETIPESLYADASTDASGSRAADFMRRLGCSTRYAGVLPQQSHKLNFFC